MAFPVMDPSEFFSDYSFEIGDADTEQLKLTRSEDAQVMVIVTVTQGGKEITANLAAPIVLNSVTLTGLQVVLDDSRYRGQAQSDASRKQECRKQHRHCGLN